MNSLYDYELKLMEHQTLVKRMEQRSQLISTISSGSRSSRGTMFGRILGTARDFIGSLAHDSRPRLRSNEEAMASLGMAWNADPAYDATLAQQIESARLQRQAGTVAPAAARPARLAPATIVLKPRTTASQA